MEEVSKRLDEVKSRMSDAAQRAGRNAGDITLVAVSKTYPADSVRAAMEGGQAIFGESKVQELLPKVSLLPSSLRWHFIGHLQSNKVRKLLPCCELIHSIDSSDLAREVDRIAEDMGCFPKALLEVNVSGEASKYGFSPDKVKADLEALLSLPRLQIEGLMTIAPYVEKAEEVRPLFAALRDLRDELSAQAGIPLSTLSMGMSGDFEVAIEEGATLVRVGSAIFGSRKKAA